MNYSAMLFFSNLLNGCCAIVAGFHYQTWGHLHHVASLGRSARGRDGQVASTGYLSDLRRRSRVWVASVDGEVKAQNDNQNVSSATKVAKTTKIIDGNNSNSTSSRGLLPNRNFQLYCRLHCTLTMLRKYFPALLDLPTVSSSIAQQWIYDSNITITGPKGEQLAVGVDEVIAITRALAVVTTAARRAGSLLDMAVAGRGASSSPESIAVSDKVECELIMDPVNPFQVLVLWRTRIPAPSISNTDRQYTEFMGKSIVELSRKTGRVSNLQIQKVKINGVTIIESLGSTLATIRKTARSSPLFESLTVAASTGSSSGNPFLDGLLNGIRDVVDAVDALPSASNADNAEDGSSLYVLPEMAWKNSSFPLAGNTTESAQADISHDNGKPTNPVLIDEYSSTYRVPLVGSESFVQYTLLHLSLDNFAKNGLHQLAGTSSSIRDKEVARELRDLFSSDVRLVTSAGSNEKAVGNDYKTLLKGASNIADLYRSLSLLRQSSGGDWNAANTEFDWRKRSLVVSWESKSPLKVEGSDRFIFEKPWLASSSIRLPLMSDGNNEDIAKICRTFFNDATTIPLKVDRIENLNLTVGGIVADSEWTNAFIAAALRGPIPDPTISELLRSLANRPKATKKSSPPRKGLTLSSQMPILHDSAAASFYGILRSLHMDLSSIGNLDIKSSIPAGTSLAEDIQLRGLLKERLVSGFQGYNRLVGLSISSLRTALQSGRVRLAAAPKPTVEVTARGSIKVDLVLALWIDAPSFPLTQPGGQAGGGGFGVPLKIQLVSEYFVNTDGKIREHVILESRLNGVLTPGDVFSRWIQGLTSPDQADETGNGMPVALEQLVGALNWVRSMQNRQNK